MKNFKIKSSILVCLSSTMVYASIPNLDQPIIKKNITTNVVKSADGYHIKLFNDSGKSMYYFIDDQTWNIHQGKQLTGVLPALSPEGEPVTFDMPLSEDHHGGRIYLSDQPITNVGTDEPHTSKPYNFIEYNVGVDVSSKKLVTDFDVSAVDGIYSTPFAVEAVNYNEKGEPQSDGWAGIISKDAPADYDKVFQGIETFKTAVGGWPAFIASITPGASKIPGAYNLFALSSDLEDTQIRENLLLQRWEDWKDTNKMCHAGSQAVAERGIQNCIDFSNKVKSLLPNPPRSIEDLKNLYGYVLPYNRDGESPLPYPGNKATVIALQEGLSGNGQDSQYIYPDYNSPYCLNPYATFIHKDKYLNLKRVYAFSLDDQVANIRYEDEGVHDLYVDLGSLNRLPNKNEYNTPSKK